VTTLTAAELHRAVASLRRGGVVLYPTETVYGFGCDVRDGAACARVRALKGVPADRPLIALVRDLAQAAGMVHLTPDAERLARAHWPGALTLVLPGREGGTVALRASSHPVPQALIDGLGGAITSTSANRAGEPPPRRAADASWVGEAGPDVSLDAGPTSGAVGSTIVDCCGPRPRLLRRGDLPVDALVVAVEVGEDG